MQLGIIVIRANGYHNESEHVTTPGANEYVCVCVYGHIVKVNTIYYIRCLYTLCMNWQNSIHNMFLYYGYILYH